MTIRYFLRSLNQIKNRETMTKVRDLTKGCCECRCKGSELIKGIQLDISIDRNGNKEKTTMLCKEWENVELITKGYGQYDILYCYDDNERGDGVLYLGYWNDGVVV